jgi:hypothetical protein
MSFFHPELHHLQQHAAFFEYETFQGPLCLACFLHSLADAAQLDSRKTFVLRYQSAAAAEDTAPYHEATSVCCL